MREVTYRDALREAMAEEMRRDSTVFVMGEEVGYYQGAYKVTRGLLEEEDVRRITRTMPLRKVARPEDVASQVVVLASERLSGHVTGQLVTVAGGMEGRVVHAE